MYTPEEKIILQVRPGITDWASIWNADEGSLLVGAADPDQAYLNLIRPTKIRLQMQYVSESGLWADLKIILLTLMAITRPQSRTVHEVRRRLAVIT